MASCVACKKDGCHPLKVLRCFHTLCTECLDCRPRRFGGNLRVSCPICNEKTVLPTAGAPPGCGLPDSPADRDKAEQSGRAALEEDGGVVQIFCQKCKACCPSKGLCMECDVRLCEAHIKSHLLSEETSKHEIVSLVAQGNPNSGAGARRQDALGECPAHVGNSLEQFCVKCDKALCGKCTLHHRCHLDRRNRSLTVVKSMEQGYSWRKEAVGGVWAAQAKDLDHTQQKALSELQASIQAATTLGDKASEDISDAFKDMRKAMKIREKQLLANVSQQAAEKVRHLQEQEKRLHLLPALGEVAASLTEMPNGVDFWRLSSWWEQSIVKRAEMFRTQPRMLVPCDPGALIFERTSMADAERLVSVAGQVHNIHAYSGMSTLFCPEVGHVDRPYEIAVLVGEEEMNTKSSDDKDGTSSLAVQVMNSDQQLIPCKLSLKAPGCYRTSFTPGKPGMCTISAKVASEHVEKSPAEVCISDGDSFLPPYCHLDIMLSNCNQTALNLGPNDSWRLAYCLHEYIDGTVHVVLDKVPSQSLRFGFCRSKQPSLDIVPGALDAAVWCGDGNEAQPSCGPALGQPWVASDLLSFSVNSRAGTIDAFHERTGARQSFPGVKGRPYFFVAMCAYGQQVSIRKQAISDWPFAGVRCGATK